MLTRASDYLYYTPIADGIHGQPLPARTGAEKSVVTYEDLLYLAEMVAERSVWSEARTSTPTYSGQTYMRVFGQDGAQSLLLKADYLKNIYLAAYLLTWNPQSIINDCLGVRVDWNASLSDPIVGTTAIDTWRSSGAMPAPPTTSAAIVNNQVVLSTSAETTPFYDDMFDYLDSFKRYVFRSGSIAAADDIGTTAAQAVILAQVGDLKITDDDGEGHTSSYTSNYAAFPWHMRDYDPRGSTPKTYTQTAEATDGYRLYVHSPFAANRLTGVIYSSPTVYLIVSGTATVYTSTSTVTHETILVQLGTLSGAPTSIQGDGWQLYYPMQSQQIMLPLVQFAYAAFKDWAEANVAGFSMSGANRCVCSVQLSGLYYDTGVIRHCSNLAS